MSRADVLKTLLPHEADLCAAFVSEFNEQDGWTCYPETGGFDIVVAHSSGRQIGVEAKLQLNAKVADQILPSDGWHRYRAAGPDHRLVIVRSITDANAGIAKLLEQAGVLVWAPRAGERRKMGPGWEVETYVQFGITEKLRSAEAPAAPAEYDWGHFGLAWFDWNPAERLALPEVAPSLPAGVPAPVQMTPWKMGAIRVLARLRAQGHITAKEILAEGISPSMWTQRWLARGAARGEWVETADTPKLDLQHPELFAPAFARAVAAVQEARAA